MYALRTYFYIHVSKSQIKISINPVINESHLSLIKIPNKALGKQILFWIWVQGTTFRSLRATLPKILISNFHPEIDFAHNSSLNFSWQVGNKHEIISEKLNFFKIF